MSERLKSSGIVSLYNLLFQKLYKSPRFSLSITSPEDWGYLPKVLTKITQYNEDLTNHKIYFNDLYTFEYYSDVKYKLVIVNEGPSNPFLKIYADFRHIQQNGENTILFDIVKPSVIVDASVLNPDNFLRFHESYLEYPLNKTEFLQACKILNPHYFPEKVERLCKIPEIMEPIFIYSSVLTLTCYILDFILHPQNYVVEIESKRNGDVVRIFDNIREYLLSLDSDGNIDLILSKLSTLGSLMI